MPFPESQRFIYDKNPLDQVICQLRFPTILKIEADLPVQFQEDIRKQYPLLTEKAEVNLPLPPELGQKGPLQINKKAYDFSSPDENWIVGLTSSFLALTSKQYQRWEEFRNHLETPLEALTTHYSPVFFSRVGLRYVDVIERSAIGLENSDWAELIQPYIVGEIANADVKNNVVEKTNVTLIRLENDLGYVRLRHGLVKRESDELCYLIDSDFYTEMKTEVTNVFEILSQYNKRARRLFRWCITAKLHDAMGPQSIS